MRFDDRLLTVLSQPAGDRRDAAVRWRQLVDLVARAGPNSTSPVVARALDSIRSEGGRVEERLRAAAARAVAALPLPLGLLECFASDKLGVSAPVLAAATLDAAQWRALLVVADAETRRFVETLHPEAVIAPSTEIESEPTPEPEPELETQDAPALIKARPEIAAPPSAETVVEAKVGGAFDAETRADAEIEVEAEWQPEADQAEVEPDFEPESPLEPESEADLALSPTSQTEPGAEPETDPEIPAPAPAVLRPSLSDVVARIERRRRSREPYAGSDESAASGPAVGAPSLFRWECQPSGEIAWVDGVPRGALIGRSIARTEEESGARIDGEVVRAFAMRAPFRDAALVVPGEGLASGEWKISGVPAFDPADGRFAGYRGIAMRDVPVAAPAHPLAADVLADPDSLRELVHEIKTPLNAIVGFAEIIEGQYLGPADRRYRQRASDIVGHARLLLGAIDDLDFAAQLHSSTPEAGQRSDIGEQLESLSTSLRELAQARDVEIEIARPRSVQPCHVEPELLDRLLYRLCSTLIEHSGAGERLRLEVDQSRGNCRLSINRPEALRSATEHQLFDATSAGEGSELRIGFTLRLVRGLARIAGGDLVAGPESIALTLPSA